MPETLPADSTDAPGVFIVVPPTLATLGRFGEWLASEAAEGADTPEGYLAAFRASGAFPDLACTMFRRAGSAEPLTPQEAADVPPGQFVGAFILYFGELWRFGAAMGGSEAAPEAAMPEATE